MTIIAGIRCLDGLIVAADTAVTWGDAVFHDRKVDYYKGQGGSSYMMAIACAGDLGYAKMASQNIRDAVAGLTQPSLSDIKVAMGRVILDIYTAHIYPMWNARGHTSGGDFELIAGVAVQDKFDVFATSRTAIYSIQRYTFEGSGAPIGQHLAERYLRSRNNYIMTIPTAVAVHIIQQFFNLLKISAPGVGRDTEIVAWRNSDDADKFFDPPPQMNEWLWAIEENLKFAIWGALEGSGMSDSMFGMTVEKIAGLLKTIRQHSLKERNMPARAVRFVDRDKREW